MHRRSSFYSSLGVCAAVLLLFGLIAGPAAQAATPAAIDEYVAQQPSPGGTAGTGGQGGAGQQGAQGVSGSNAEAENPAGTEAVSGGGGGGALPFTGYPMTTLAWLVLAFVLAGLTIRGYIAIRKRIDRTEPQST